LSKREDAITKPTQSHFAQAEGETSNRKKWQIQLKQVKVVLEQQKPVEQLEV
jgi:hypothetical protein